MVRDPQRDPRRFGSRPRRDPRRTGPRPRRDRDVGHFGRDEIETLVRLETVSRPRRRDRDHIPAMQCHTIQIAQKLSIYNRFKNNTSSEID